MDDFLSDFHDDPEFGEDFGSFLSELANSIDEGDPSYQAVRNIERQYNTQSSTNNFQSVNAERHQKTQYNLQEANKYYQAKKWGLAVDHLSEVIKLDHQDSNIYLMRGHCYHNLGEKELALKDIKRAIDLDPKNAHAIIFRTGYTLSENFDETIDDLLRYFQLTQENATSEIVDLFAKFLSLEDDHWHTVINKLSQFLQIDTAKHVPIVVKIINRAGGEKLFFRLINLNEFSHDTFSIFVLLFHGFLNTDVDKTVDILSESIKNNPDKSFLYYFRSMAYHHKKHWDAALNDINRVIELNPNDYSNYKKRAEIHVEMNFPSNAIDDYEKYLSLTGDTVDDRDEIENKINMLKESTHQDEEIPRKLKDETLENDFEEALDTEDWMDVYERGKAAALQSTLTKPKIKEFTKAVKDAKKKISRIEKDEKIKSDIYIRFAQDMYEFINRYSQDVEKTLTDILNRNAADISTLGLTSYRIDALDHLEPALQLLKDINDEEAIKLRHKIKKAIVWICYYYCKPLRIEVVLGDSKMKMSQQGSLKIKQKWIERHDELLLEIRITDPEFKKSHGKNKWAIDRLEFSEDGDYDNLENLENRQSRMEILQAQIDKQNQLKEVEYRRKYWEAHPEEYQLSIKEQRRKEEQRESQRAAIKEKISKLEEKITKNNHEVENLRFEKGNLGPLAFKKKKEIDEKIDSLISAKTKVQNEVNELRQQLMSL